VTKLFMIGLHIGFRMDKWSWNCPDQQELKKLPKTVF
jgi:hypothetical protein